MVKASISCAVLTTSSISSVSLYVSISGKSTNRMKEAKQKSSQQSYSDKVISKKEPVR